MVSDFSKKKILIVGLGLMGGSIAKALKSKTAAVVWAVDNNTDIIGKAKKEGVIDEGYTTANESTGKADFIIVCLYPELAVEFINENMESFKSGAVITDICGVKKPVVDKVNITRDDIDFVPGHPMAGSESKGYECSFVSLFEGCNYIITPLDGNSKESLNLVSEFAKILGAKKIVESTPEEHDELISYTSQIPHALAVAYMHSSKERDILPFAGGSFRDVSRVALINEVMWTELFSQNRKKLVEELKSLEENLEKMTKLIEQNDLDALEEYMRAGAKIKENYDASNNS